MSDNLELIKTIPAVNIPGLTNIQKGWIRLADLKVLIQDKLTTGELEIQSKLKDIENEKDLKKVQDLIKECKDIAAENKAARLYFTNMIKEKLTQPMMEFEERNESLIATANSHELALRQEASRKKMADAKKLSEIAALKAHITNEHLRIGAEYRARLAKLIVDSYTQALKDKVPVNTIRNYVKQIHNFLCAEKLSPFVKFERELVSDEEAKEIFKAIEPYKSKPDLDAAIIKLNETFTTYESDLKNAKKVIKAVQENFEHQQEEEQQNLEQEIETNKLVSQADTYTITETGGAKTDVKKVYEIEEENSEAWALAVVGAFVKNWHKVKGYLKVKTWGKLSISQMGAALAKLHSETGQTFSDIKFKVIEK